jgi:hypothetical protein
MSDRYPVETLDAEEDNGTMVENVDELREHVVGHRIVSAEHGTARVVETGWNGKLRTRDGDGFIITLDNGEKVLLESNYDCCAYTQLESFLLHPEMVDHIITGVGTTDHYETWHIYADLGDVLELKVGWSAGNPFYYGYGFSINVIPIDGEVVDETPGLPAPVQHAITAGGAR